MSEIITIHTTLDLVYSPDDRGWYFQDYDQDKTSFIYESKAEAMVDLKADKINWDDSSKENQ